MKDAKTILYEHATNNSDGFMAGQVAWVVQAMEEYAAQFKSDTKEKMFDDGLTAQFSAAIESTFKKAAIEKEYLEMFNRIRCAIYAKKNKKCVPVRKIAKAGQLHAALKIYSMDELGKVIYGVYSDKFHHDNNYKYATTEFCTRQTTIDKFLQ
jgi:hypothetical protein